MSKKIEKDYILFESPQLEIIETGEQIIFVFKAKQGQTRPKKTKKAKKLKNSNSYRMFLWIGAENKAVHVKI